MASSRRLVVLAGVLILAGAAVLTFRITPLWRDLQEPSEVTRSILEVDAGANTRERQIHDVPTELDLVLGTSSSPLLRPESVQIDGHGNLWVFDWGALNIKKFSPDGELLWEYGGKQGRGPGELISPTDFALGANGEVWVLDPGQGRINIYDAEGRPVRHVRLNVPALRFLLFPPKQILLVTLSDNLFTLVDSVGVLIRTFGQLVQDQSSRALAVQGEVEHSGPDEFVYASLYGGYIGRFRLNGETVFFRETVMGNPFPPVESTPSGAQRIARSASAPIAAYAVTVDSDRIYVLSKAVMVRDTLRVIDVYAVHDGQYAYSFAVPEKPVLSIEVKDSTLYTVSDTTVTRWRLGR